MPAAYAARDLVSRVHALDTRSGDLLIQHGVNDEIVPVEQSCALVAVASGSTSYHVVAAGRVVMTAPSKCGTFGITWSAGPLPDGWPGHRYLVIYDNFGHGDGPNAARQSLDALGFLRIELC